MNQKTFLIALLAIVTIAFAGGAYAADCNCATCYECRTAMTNSSCDRIILTASLSNQGDCIYAANSDDKIFDCDGHFINGQGTSAGDKAIQFLRTWTDNNLTVQNCIIQDYDIGIYLETVDGFSLINSTIYNNNINVYNYNSTNLTLINNTLSESFYYDFYNQISSEDQCNYVWDNNTGTDGRPIGYYNSSVNLSDTAYDQLILCNADDSNLTNVTIEGSGSYKNNDLTLWFSSGVTIENINSSSNRNGIMVYGGENNTINGSIFYNNAEVGIFLASDMESVDYTNITNNEINYNEMAGIYAASISNSIFSGNHLYNNSDYGIFIEALSGSNDNNKIIGNDMTNSSQVFIELFSGNNTEISGNNMTGMSSTWAGLDAESCTYLNVTGNIINNIPNGAGLAFIDGSNNSAVGNDISESPYGIYFGSESYGTAKDNVIYITSRSIEFVEDDYMTAFNNTLAYSSVGIDCTYITEGNLSENNIDNTEYGMTILACDDANIDIIKNNFTNTDENAIYIEYSSNISIEENHVSEGLAMYGIFIKETDYVDILSNVVEDAYYAGMLLYFNTNYMNLVDNLVQNIEGTGIDLESSENATLINNTITNTTTGLTLGCSPYGYYRNNTMYGNDYNFDFNNCGELTLFDQDLDESNTVDGKPIRFYYEENDISVTDAGVIYIASSSNVTIQNAVLDEHEIRGVMFADISDITLNNITFPTIIGIEVTWIDQEQWPDTFSDGITVSNCNFFTEAGMFLAQSNNLNIINNVFNSSEDHDLYTAIYTEGTDGALISGNKIYNYIGDAIYGAFLNNTQIVNNYINSSEYTEFAIALWLSENTLVENNEIYGENGWIGIFVGDSSTDGTVQKNKVCGFDQLDIYFEASTSGFGGNNICTLFLDDNSNEAGCLHDCSWVPPEPAGSAGCEILRALLIMCALIVVVIAVGLIMAFQSGKEITTGALITTFVIITLLVCLIGAISQQVNYACIGNPWSPWLN